jgi:hypothetical protein
LTAAEFFEILFNISRRRFARDIEITAQAKIADAVNDTDN